jgi:ornithine carbamoyltransferase
MVGMDFAIASPIGYGLDDESLDLAKGRSENTNCLLSAVVEPLAAVKSADIVYTDVWTSMGDESESDIRREIFSGYTVDEELLREAKPDAIFMHDMPAHYGEEVVAGMLEHPQSVAYIQANNRLHCQKAILEFILQR